MQIKPLHDRVVVRLMDAETRSPAGIVIPDNAKEKPTRGEVLAVGPGIQLDDGRFIATTVRLGERVLFAQHAGQKVKVEDEEVTILREQDILAIVN